MIRIRGIALLLATAPLASCGGGHPKAAADPGVAQCRAQVSADPVVKHLQAVQAGSLWLQADGQADLAEARRQALLTCLRARGLAPPGGVEAPRAAPGTFNGLF